MIVVNPGIGDSQQVHVCVLILKKVKQWCGSSLLMLLPFLLHKVFYQCCHHVINILSLPDLVQSVPSSQ